MKIAYCISGQMRNFDHDIVIKKLNKYILEPLQPDVFIDTWDDHRGGSYYSIHNNLPIPQNPDEPVLVDSIKKIYDPVVLKTENYKDWESKILKNQVFANAPQMQFNAAPMFYKMWSVNKTKSNYEKEHGFKYDIVIRSRADIIFFRSLKQEWLNGELWTNNNGNIMHDVFLTANSDTMDKVVRIWQMLSLYFINYNSPPPMLTKWCKDNVLKWNAFPQNELLEVYRTDDDLRNPAWIEYLKKHQPDKLQDWNDFLENEF